MSDPVGDYLVINCGAQRFALPRAQVARKLHAAELALMPRIPPWLCGAGQVAGRVLSVIDLAALLGEPAQPRAEWVAVSSTEGALVLAVDASVESRGADAEGAAAPLGERWVKIGAQAVVVLSLEKLWGEMRTKS
jgi:chemotaxis signal transduction protein